MRLLTLLAGAPVVIWAVAAAAEPGDATDKRGDLYDYLVKDVCLTADGRIDARRIPGYSGAPDGAVAGPCGDGRGRNMRPADPNYYGTHHWPYTHLDEGCSAVQRQYGARLWHSVPATLNGKTRVILVKDNSPSDCDAAFAEQLDFAYEPGAYDQADRYSARWFDERFGFLLFSDSPRAFGYHKSEHYCDKIAAGALPRDSEKKFWRGWLMAGLDAPSRRRGEVRSVIEAANLDSGAPGEPGFHECPDVYTAILHLWVRAEFRFMNNARYDAVVTQKFSGDARGGRHFPAGASQFERIYMTDEFGIARWEQWRKLPDGVRVETYDPEWSLVKHCSAPYDLPDADAAGPDHMTTSPVRRNPHGLYSETYAATEAESRRATYVMARCEDFTNLQPAPGGAYAPPELDPAYDAFFRE